MVLLFDYLPSLGKQCHSLSLKEQCTEQGRPKSPARPWLALRAWDHHWCFTVIFSSAQQQPTFLPHSCRKYPCTPTLLPYTPCSSALPSPLSHSDIQVLKCLWPASSVPVLPHADMQGGFIRRFKSQRKPNHIHRLDGTMLPCESWPCLWA